MTAPGVTVGVVSVAARLAAARDTVLSAAAVLPAARLLVLDVDGSWSPVADEVVLRPSDVGLPDGELHRRVAAVGIDPVADAAAADLAAHGAAPVHLAVRAGVVLLAPPAAVLDALRDHEVAVLPRTPARVPPDDGRWPDAADVVRAGALHPGLVAVRGRPAAFLAAWSSAWRRPGQPWLDVAATLADAAVVRSRVLVGAWDLDRQETLALDAAAGTDRLTLGGQVVAAVDLTDLDPERPWSLRPDVLREPRARLSDHRALAELVQRAAARRRATPAGEGAWDPERSSSGHRIDRVVRWIYLRSVSDATGAVPPDPYASDDRDALTAWLREPRAVGRLGRYLGALLETRPDLRAAFPSLPGEHLQHFLDWALEYGVHEDYDPDLLRTAVEAVQVPAGVAAEDRPRGVNLVGYLDGELGIGESARLMRSALEAAGVPTAPVAVDRHLVSPSRTTVPTERPTQLYDTTLVCVNADLTPSVAATVPHVLAAGRTVGMWYWELEAFPPGMGASADRLDEVWVATDFIHDAVEPHVDVPVRVVTPPLPQAYEDAPVLDRAELGLPPDRPFVLFSFDYLSAVERKNPDGLLAAFRRAFRRDEGPLLVLKSINAHHRPLDAERLRLLTSDEPDVILLEQHLAADVRDALVRSCDAYASLHRAEGLGLTMAEAMAWGKPVIATRYGGNLQFMDDGNSFLVGAGRVPVPDGVPPYPAGTPWADPDLDEAAHAIRLALDDHDLARTRGAAAAHAIRTLHSPQAAARRVALALDALHTPVEPAPEEVVAPAARARGRVARWMSRG
ncbi:glycosyltransferase family 4 protein [Cellulomonas sp.]|uniref:glycosyltransferase family 4 protein n=1 Tax=Cellulomonas sp. TaxID=40001 RepID=UPI002811EFE0|nr:glycosyltransferase family 4 protein [Cellulomonas sp.]